MANDELIKQIQKLLKDEVRPVKEFVEILKNKVDKMGLFQNVIMGQVRIVKDQQSVINEKLDELKETLDATSASVVTIEKEIKAYGDMYKINNSNSKKLEKRMEVLEENAGIEPSPEFILADVA